MFYKLVVENIGLLDPEDEFELKLMGITSLEFSRLSRRKHNQSFSLIQTSIISSDKLSAEKGIAISWVLLYVSDAGRAGRLDVYNG